MNKELEQKLNIYLANQLVDDIKKHDLHWNLKGSNFFTLHAKLEELYENAADIADEVAERMLALDMQPIASMHEAIKIATIKELPTGAKSGELVIKTLISDTNWWIKESEEIIALADKVGDVGTADIFTGYLKEYQKLAWMLKAYIG